MALGATPAQTVGPFFAVALPLPLGPALIPPGDPRAIRLHGEVRDGAGDPVPDAMLEIWQANHHGRYRHPTDGRTLPLDPAFTGFGRSDTDSDGAYWFETIKPGRVPFDEYRLQAPHICVAVFARGLLNHAFTRLYFADDPANADDPILQLAPAVRRATLLARRADDEGAVYHFEIVLQGAGETVFFNL